MQLVVDFTLNNKKNMPFFSLNVKIPFFTKKVSHTHTSFKLVIEYNHCKLYINFSQSATPKFGEPN